MALHLYGSNLLEALADKLHKNFEEEHENVFQPDYIITQTEGMKNWLLIQLAEKAGIAANIKFLSPNDLILKVAQIIGGAKFNSLSTNILCWIIYSILEEQEFVKKYPEIAAYYNSDENPDSKRIALSEKIADLFDQYQIYRHDYIEQWNAQMNLKESKNWQEYMWVRVKQICEEEFKDKSEQGRFIIDSLQNVEKQIMLKQRIPNIHLFGISITTPYHLDILMALGNIVNINFYLLNPAPLVYWQDSVSEKHAAYLKRAKKVSEDELIIGNSLLTSWGKIIRETYSLLFKNEDTLNNYTDIGEEEPGTYTLLHKIQQDIFYNLHGEKNEDGTSRNIIKAEDLNDSSITINSCFTIAREVEVLYNYLVHLVDQRKEELSARDIVVMVSDIDSYAPYIKAVFENSRYKFKFTIADETFNSGDNLMNALQSLLSFKKDDFKGESIMSLLDSSFIKNKFSINNLSLIRTVVEQANIRFGINGSHSDDTIYLSWKYGIQKIIYSISMSACEEYIFEDEGYFLVDIVEGADANEVICFFYFVNQLINYVEDRDKERPLNEWVNYTEDILEKFLWDISNPAVEEYDILMKQLEGFNTVQKFVDVPVKYEVFSRVLLKHLSTETRNSAFANGGITFCSLIPMRSIPFKVVALLGLNFDKFPRKDTAISFNLINEEKRKGDRNTKDNDKHLFLETLLSAQKYLYISYIGQSVADNAMFPPSVLVDELVDYIDEATEKGENKSNIRNAIIVKHPLHSFSSKYGNENNLYNYLQLNPETVADILGDEKSDVEIKFDISVESIISFFKNPIKYYYNNVLEIKYYNDDELLPETEIFSLDVLDKWILKSELLKRFENIDDGIETEWIKKGSIPLKNVGKIVYSELVNDVHPIYKTLKEITQDKVEETISIDLEIGQFSITGNLNRVFDGVLVYVVFRENIKAKDYLEAYLKYLLARASGKIKSLIIIDGAGESVTIKQLSEEEAKIKLAEIFEIFVKAQSSLVAFSPDWFDLKKISELNWDSFIKGIEGVVYPYNWEPDQFLVMEYNAGLFDDEKVFEDYLNIANLLLIPLNDLFAEAE